MEREALLAELEDFHDEEDRRLEAIFEEVKKDMEKAATSPPPVVEEQHEPDPASTSSIEVPFSEPVTADDADMSDGPFPDIER